MSNEIKEKEEYEKYARDHRKELDAQEVKIGDVVTVLIGHFAGEKGVIVGMIACDKSDYADPYYEIEMECDVPEEFRVRKTLIGQSRVIGGVEKRYLKVIGNRAPKQPSMEIKQGDKVRVSRDVPQFYLEYNSYRMFEIEHRVVDVNMEDGFALLDSIPSKFTTILPTKYLVKVEEEKEAKFKRGDKVVFKCSDGDVIQTIHSCRYDEIMKDWVYNFVEGGAFFDDGFFEPYTEPTAPKIKVGDKVEELVSRKSGRVLRIEGDFVVVGIPYDKEKHYWHIDSVELVEPTEQTEAEKKPNVGSITIPVKVDLDDTFWDSYTADLAKEIAVKVANKFNDPKEAAEYAVSVAKSVVEGLKRK